MSLQVEIYKDFGKFKLDVEFEAENEVLGLLGASGCGKSMTLKCIAGIVTPDRGKIVADGVTLFDSQRHINLSPQKRHVGLLFQNYALFPNMSVAQNIRTGCRRSRMGRLEAKKTVERMMDKLHLNDVAHLRPAQLSGGQQQRAALARILVSKPRILMLDEPLSALDAYLRWTVEAELAGILEDYGQTALFVSHECGEVYRLCDRVCAMAEGRAARPVPAAQMFLKPESISAALLSGCKNISRARRLSKHTLLALDWGITLWSGREVPATLQGVGIQAYDLTPAPSCEADARAKAKSGTGHHQAAGEKAGTGHHQAAGEKAGTDHHWAAGEKAGSGAAAETKNVFCCEIQRRMEEPAQDIYILRLCNAKNMRLADGGKLRMDRDKALRLSQQPGQSVHIKIDDEKLMFFSHS